MDIRSCIAEVIYGIQGVLSSKYEKDCCEFYKEKHRALELHASMRKAEICVIMPQTHFRNAKNCQNLGDCPGRESHSQKNVGWGEIAAY